MNAEGIGLNLVAFQLFFTTAAYTLGIMRIFISFYFRARGPS